MRFAILLILAVFFWAGTVSIKYPRQFPAVTASSGNPCSGQSHGERLLEYLKRGTITRIHDNGQILTIGLSLQWGDLSPSQQQKTYNSVVCYAQSQNRQFQFLITQQL